MAAAPWGGGLPCPGSSGRGMWCSLHFLRDSFTRTLERVLWGCREGSGHAWSCCSHLVTRRQEKAKARKAEVIQRKRK